MLWKHQAYHPKKPVRRLIVASEIPWQPLHHDPETLDIPALLLLELSFLQQKISKNDWPTIGHVILYHPPPKIIKPGNQHPPIIHPSVGVNQCSPKIQSWHKVTWRFKIVWQSQKKHPSGDRQGCTPTNVYGKSLQYFRPISRGYF